MNRSGTPHAAKTVLICEDDPNLRTLVRLALGNGYCFVEAGDGDDAMARLADSRPDLIVLDLMLPGRSGFDLLREIRGKEGHEATPIVVISAWSHSDTAAVAAGADRFVPKPFDPEDLRATADDLLKDDGNRG